MSLYFVYNHTQVFSDLSNPAIPFKVFGLIIFSGIVCGFLANVLFYYTLQTNASFLVTTLTSTVPLFAMFFALILLHEHINCYNVLGVVLVVAGCALVLVK
jgi:drug/metabolite transporter (DMT)-like permease